MAQMRTEAEQVAGLKRLITEAGRLHRISLQLKLTPGDVCAVSGLGYAEDFEVVFALGGYDLWGFDDDDDFVLLEPDLTLDQAAVRLADLYMEAKTRAVITKTWGMPAWKAEAVLADPAWRAEFFADADAGSDKAEARLRLQQKNN